MSTHLKRLLSFTLAVLLTCSNIPLTILPAYAATPEISTGGDSPPDDMSDNAGGIDTGITVGRGGDWGNEGDANFIPTAVTQRAGFRVSLVDVNDPSKVVSIDPSTGKPRVVDIILCSQAKYQATCEVYQGRMPKMFSEIKTQPLNISEDGTKYTQQNNVKQFFLPDYQRELTNIPYENMTEKQQLLYDGLNIADHELLYNFRWLMGTNPYITWGNNLRDWLVVNKSGEAVYLQTQNATVDPSGEIVSVPPSSDTNKKSNGATGKPNTSKPAKTGNKTSSQEAAALACGQQAVELIMEALSEGANKFGKSAQSKLKSRTAWVDKYQEVIKWERSQKNSLKQALDSGWINQAQYNTYIANVNSTKRDFQDAYGHALRAYAEQDTPKYNSSNATKKGSTTTKTGTGRQSFLDPIDKALSGGYSSNVPNEYNKDRLEWQSPQLNNGNKPSLLASLYNTVFNPITAYAAEGDDTDEDTKTSSHSTDGTANTEDNADKAASHLSLILQLPDENGVPLFVTADTYDAGNKKVKQLPNSTNYMTVLYKDPNVANPIDYRVLIEPVDWFTPHSLDGSRVLSPVRFYGTVTNIAQAMQLYRINNGKTVNEILGGQQHLNRKTFNKISWCALTTAQSEGGSETKDPGFKDFKFTEVNEATVPGIGQNIFTNAQIYSLSQFGLEGSTTTLPGWGVQVYWPSYSPSNNTHTWDYENHPDGLPAPAPELTPDIQKQMTKSLQVAKFYYTETDTSEYLTDVQTQPLSGSPIQIENEGDINTEYYWEVVGWSTGQKNEVPTTNDISKTYEEWVDSNPGNWAGTEPSILTLPKDDPDQVLYVKLIKRILPEPGIDIVKVFEKDDGTVDIEITTDEWVPATGYDPTDERGTYIESIISPSERKEIDFWPDALTEGEPKTVSPIIKDVTTKVIYIYYQETPNTPEQQGGRTPLILYEDELTHSYALQNLNTAGLAGIQDTFRSYNYNMSLCGGHTRDHDDCSGDHGSGQSHKPTILDNKYTLAVTSQNNNPNFILDYAETSEANGAWVHTNYKGIGGGLTDTLTPNARFLLYRDKTRDLVTLYPNKNTSLDKASRLGITAVAPTPQTSRVSNEGNGQIYDSILIKFSETGAYDRTLSWHWWCGERDYYEDEGSWNSTPVSGKTLSTLNEYYNYPNSIVEKYEVGTTNTGLTAPEKKVANDFLQAYYNNTGVDVQLDGEIKFYPYIKMIYNEKTGTGQTPYYITSTNLSTIGAYAKIESGVWKNGQHDDTSANNENPTPNVTLDSTQWSTHKNSLNFMADNAITDKKSVLPGGATFDVSMGKANTAEWTGPADDTPTTSTKLGYRVWQTCIDDSLTAYLDPSSTAPTLNEAKQNVTELDKSIKKAVPTYGLIQTVATGISEYEGYMAKYVNNSGYDIVESGGTWNSIPLSSDAKYYLKLIAQDSSSGTNEFNSTVTNFDILQGGIKQQKVYTIKSDTEGTVTVLLDNNTIGSITKTQTIQDLLSQSPDIKLLDEETKLVTNYINGIDRNRGRNQRGEQWYNEAFDGVSVLYSYLSYDIGFGNSIGDGENPARQGTATRSAVLDTKLTGALANKSDLYNFEAGTQDTKVRSSMILTGALDNKRNPSGELGVLPLKNGSNITMKLNDMEIFAYSKIFYIPNANVTDLN